MNDMVFAAAYIAAGILFIVGPVLLMDWVFGILYRHSRRFRRRANKIFRAMTGR